MPRRATGNVLFSKGSYYARVTLRPKDRRAFRLPTVSTEDAARARAEVLADLAAQLRGLDQIDLAVKLVEAGANASDGAELDDVIATVRRVCAGELRARPTNATTFRELGEDWTNGRLADRWPDHVKRKKSAHRDAALLRARVYPLVGHVRLADFTLEHAEMVMRSLPRGLEPPTRRQHAQAIARLLALAAYPARVIERSPIPRGFVPPQRSNKAKSYLYPSEDRSLLACAAVPLDCRMLYGFLAREGMREGEARVMTRSDLDLERGAVKLDRNKTDDPRAWMLHPGGARALERWLGDAPPGALVFGAIDFDWSHAAVVLRGHLKAAGVTRPELFEASKARLRVRVHDLRGTFVTLSLANGRTETWVADRTGHKSSTMINGYRRAARTAAELGLGELAPLDEAIPELAPVPEKAPEKAPETVEAARVAAYTSGIVRQSRAGGMAYAGDLKSLAGNTA